MPEYMMDYSKNKKGERVETHRTQPSLDAVEQKELREKQQRAALTDDLLDNFIMNDVKKKPKLANIQSVEKYSTVDQDLLDHAWKQRTQQLKELAETQTETTEK